VTARELRGASAALALVLVLAAPTLGSASAAGDEDAALRARIESRLAPLAEPVEAEIRVYVRDGQVVLTGAVPLLEHSLRASQKVWQTEGVRDVDNELEVRPLVRPTDETIEQRIRTLIKGEPPFLDAQVAVEVRAGSVRLSGYFEDPSDVLALKHRVASIAGVVELEIDAVLHALRRDRRDPPVA
jgi:osmotically-inducible protein OsmY